MSTRLIKRRIAGTLGRPMTTRQWLTWIFATWTQQYPIGIVRPLLDIVVWSRLLLGLRLTWIVWGRKTIGVNQWLSNWMTTENISRALIRICQSQARAISITDTRTIWCVYARLTRLKKCLKIIAIRWIRRLSARWFSISSIKWKSLAWSKMSSRWTRLWTWKIQIKSTKEMKRWWTNRVIQLSWRPQTIECLTFTLLKLTNFKVYLLTKISLLSIILLILLK